MSTSAKASSEFAAASTRSSIAKTYVDPIGGHTYRYIPGSFTQQEAWQVARSKGGYPVVFNTLREWRRVVQGLDYRSIAPAHTGHYQLSTGREPGIGWTTHSAGGVSTAPLNQLFNSDGPDDGIRNKWGWNLVFKGDGSITGTAFYGPSNGKNEDAGVIWYDAEGRLEDVSVNGRYGVVVEFSSSGRSRSSTRTQSNPDFSNTSSTPDQDDLTQVGTDRKDTLVGGTEDDVLTGLGGDDQLFGKQGNDVLKGGDGNDRLYGGLGQDILFGGNGDDLFVMNLGSKLDIIRDFEIGRDQIGISQGSSANRVDLAQQGGNTLIKVNNTAVALLQGINVNQMTTEHFVAV